MKRKVKQSNFIIGFILVLFMFVTCYKLTNASLWFDETVEYWYSKILIGTLPFDDRFTNMYQRIISTFQPPLYNILMFFGLKFWIQNGGLDFLALLWVYFV